LQGSDCPQTTTYPRSKEARPDDLLGSSFGASSGAPPTKSLGLQETKRFFVYC
jgi:hypothetical protein